MARSFSLGTGSSGKMPLLSRRACGDELLLQALQEGVNHHAGGDGEHGKIA